MRRFLLKIVLFLAVFLLAGMLLALLCFRFVLPQYSQTYPASLLDKVSLAESIDEPKILLIGDSNLAFGMDSSRLSGALGMPVVNMGLHGGLGNTFHEELAWQYAKAGDIVVVCHTSFATENQKDSLDYLLLCQTLENHTNLYPLVKNEDGFSLLRAIPKYLFDATLLQMAGTGNQEAPNSCYNRKAFNAYGDNIFPRPEAEFTFTDQSQIPIDEAGVASLNRLNAYLQSIGAKMVVAGVPIGKGPFSPSIESTQTFQKELAEKLDCPVISDFTNYYIDYQYFYDTRWHLTNEGVQIRTDQLIEDMQNWMRAES